MTYEQIILKMINIKKTGGYENEEYLALRKRKDAMKIPGDFLCMTCIENADIFLADSGLMTCGNCSLACPVISKKENERINLTIANPQDTIS